MRNYFCSRALVASYLVALATSASAQVASTFDAGLDGWTGSGGAVSFVSTGGNPGGFLQQIDNLNSFMAVSAPAKFLGNLSSFFGGTISFDAKNIGNTPSDLPAPGPWFGTVTIAGSAGSVTGTLAGTTAGSPQLDGQWHTYSAVLNTGSWSGSLAPVLSNVTGISVQLEFGNTIVETAGFDNFRVSAVPEPSTAAFLVVGLSLLLVVRKRAA